MRIPIPWLVAFVAFAGPSHADTTRTQILQLRAGWNSVYLEVQPATAKPELLFQGLPVDTVAAFFPGRLHSQYLRSPGDAPWREEGWAVWYASSQPQAFLSNLNEIQAQRAYLIHAAADLTWQVTGEARTTRIDWHPNTCTLTGLPVDPEAPPTFAEFFEASPAHRRLRVFRLESGLWKLLRQPSTEKPRSGEAYWIETDGASTYQGPLALDLPRTAELDFGSQGGTRTLGIVNRSTSRPARVEIAIASGADSLPLRQWHRDLSTLTTTTAPLPEVLRLPTLTAGAQTSVRLEPDRGAMTSPTGGALLRITDGRGTQFWLPILARRSSTIALAGQP
ncbi:MAG: hypothetical protein JNK85_17250 [Verrucomicrobiales bacterium]|nr:hypothetical protein [Verrucomicrobiales bacterium]